ncbi:MAG: DNA-binding protein [Clostridium sp.]|nr:DNA-binding protein [Clostridium sp.]MCM1172950.1 DNA-binding protein [Clostridium sp.]MCM1208860.1 DNA-binding protein [Ruminococcus sp.]
MTKRQIVDNFAANIEIERAKLGLTQLEMAQKLEMSLSSYKNMINGISANIPIYVALLVYMITGKQFFELCGYITPEIQLMIDFCKLPKYRQKAILSLVSLEAELSMEGRKMISKSEESYIPLYTLTGNMTDGMIYDSTNIQPFNIGQYKKIYGDLIDCAIKITSNHLHPVYHSGEILLVHCASPRDGDTGIFIDRENGRVYIRKLRQTSPVQLIPVSDTGKIIYIDDQEPKEMKKWIKFGHVITKIR